MATLADVLKGGWVINTAYLQLCHTENVKVSKCDGVLTNTQNKPLACYTIYAFGSIRSSFGGNGWWASAVLK